jgi:hypothetical protein
MELSKLSVVSNADFEGVPDTALIGVAVRMKAWR